MSRNMEGRASHDLRSNHGATIYMPPFAEGQVGWGNLAIPDPNNDVDTEQQYPVETVLRMDKRAWRYTLIGDVDADGVTRCIRRGIGLKNTSCINSYTDKLVSASGYNTVGVFKLKVDMTTHVNYLNAAAAVALNDYAGGHFTLYTPSSYWGCRIIGNTKEDSDGYVELTLESSLPVTLTSSHILMFEENLYWKAQYPGNSALRAATIGFPCIWSVSKTVVTDGPVTDSDYIWLQTWGPYEGIVFGNPHGGGGSDERGGYFATSGGYPDEDYYPGMAEHQMPQIAGWYTANNYKGGSPADFDYNYLTSFFLMIAP